MCIRDRSTTVAHTEEVTLTAHVSGPAQVASYHWMRVGGAFDLSYSASLTLGGAEWPHSPGVRTFRVTVTLNDGSQITADQTITFTAPPTPPEDVSVSITVSPDTTVAHTEEVTLTANVSDPSQVASYHWMRVGGVYDLSYSASLTLGGAAWPHSSGTRNFRVTVTLNGGSQVVAEQAIVFTNP